MAKNMVNSNNWNNWDNSNNYSDIYPDKNGYLNGQRYPDPTAYAALQSFDNEARLARKAQRQQEYDDKHRCRIYVVTAFDGHSEDDRVQTEMYCRFVYEKGLMPICGPLLYYAFLTPRNPDENHLAQMFGRSLLHTSQQVWVFGGEITPAMKGDIAEARRLNKIVRKFDEHMQEV